MQKLTPREKLIYSAMMEEDDRVWPVERIAEFVWGKDESKRPKAWRHGLISTMATLRIKTYIFGGNRVVKVSKNRGRGNTARYTIARTASRKGLTIDE